MIFERETFIFPGFVEFDDVNSKVLTFSATEKSVLYLMFTVSLGLSLFLCALGNIGFGISTLTNIFFD